MNVYDFSNSNRVKEHDPIALTFTRAQIYARKTMQLFEVFETLGGEDYGGAAMVALIRTANKSI